MVNTLSFYGNFNLIIQEHDMDNLNLKSVRQRLYSSNSNVVDVVDVVGVVDVAVS